MIPFVQVFLGTKLKGSARECDVYLLFEHELSSKVRTAIVSKLPACLTATTGGKGGLVYVAADAAFPAALRETVKNATGFDAAFESALTKIEHEHPLTCVVNVDGKGSSPTGKTLGPAIAEHVLPRVLEHAATHPNDETTAWLLREALLPLAKAKLDEELFAGAARAIETLALVPTEDMGPILRLLAVYFDLSKKAPAGASERVGHSPAFRLGLVLMYVTEQTLPIARELAPSIEESHAPFVGAMAARLMGTGSALSPIERGSLASALATSDSLRMYRASNPQHSIAMTLSESTQRHLLTGGKRRVTDANEATEMYRAVLRFADAPPEARGLELFALLQGERWDEAIELADEREAFANEYPHVHVHRARAFQHAGRDADAKSALAAAREGGVDVEPQFGHPVLAPLGELEHG